MPMIEGFVLRAQIDGGVRYLGSHLAWFGGDVEGAWIHKRLPEVDPSWETLPRYWARAAYLPGDGVRRIGPWKPWGSAPDEGGGGLDFQLVERPRRQKCCWCDRPATRWTSSDEPAGVLIPACADHEEDR